MPFYRIKRLNSILEEYRKRGVTYNGLAKKHKIPRATIANWLLKSKKVDPLLIADNNKSYSFLDITQQVNTVFNAPDFSSTEEITLSINGFAVNGDLTTITRLLMGGR